MACYYLVISSTHLSNGHFRSIKGVFRGPLRKTGTTLPGYAEKGKSIANTLEDLKANFYCELCDKQYHKHQEFDNHINSYDHAHKQRLKELKQREFARNVASKSWKDEKKQEKALKRLHELAELRKQPDGVTDEGPLFKTPRLKGPQEDVFANKDDKAASLKCAEMCKGEAFTNSGSRGISENKQDILCNREVENDSNCFFVESPTQLHVPFSNSGSVTNRASISFCFSKKALLKLDSSASVFNESTEEVNECSQFLPHKAKQTSVSFRHYAHVNENVSENAAQSLQDEKDMSLADNAPATAEKFKDDRSSQENTKEHSKIAQSNITTEMESQDTSCLDQLSQKEANITLETEKTTETPTEVRSQTPSGALETCSNKHTVADAILIEHLSHLLSQESGKEELTLDTDNGNSATSNESAEKFPSESSEHVNSLGESVSTNTQSKTLSFLSVLSKDGNTVLQWPTELLLFTKTQPSISYTCNPLYFDFKCSKKNNTRTANDRETRQHEKNYTSSRTNEGISSAMKVDREEDNGTESQSSESKRDRMNLEELAQREMKSYDNYRTAREYSHKAKLNHLHDNKPQVSTHFNHSRSCIVRESHHTRKRKRSCHGQSKSSKKSDRGRINEDSKEEELKRKKFLQQDHQLVYKDKWMSQEKSQERNEQNRYENGFSWESDTNSDVSQMSIFSETASSSCSMSSSSTCRYEDLVSTTPYHVASLNGDSYISGKHNSDVSSENNCISEVDKKLTCKCKSQKHKTFISESSRYEYLEHRLPCKHTRSKHRLRKKGDDLKTNFIVEQSHSVHESNNENSTSLKSRINKSSASPEEIIHISSPPGSPTTTERLTIGNAKDSTHQDLVLLPVSSRHSITENKDQHIIINDKKTLLLEGTNNTEKITEDFSNNEYGMTFYKQNCFAINSAPPLHENIKTSNNHLDIADTDHVLRNSNTESKGSDVNVMAMADNCHIIHIDAECRTEIPVEEPPRLFLSETQPFMQSPDPVPRNFACSLPPLRHQGGTNALETKEEKIRLVRPNVNMKSIPVEGNIKCYYDSTMQDFRRTDNNRRFHHKSSSPSLAQQPVTFSPDEVDKYKLLQIQAQQHMQKQLLTKHFKALPSNGSAVFSAAQTIQPVAVQHHPSITTIHHALMQRYAVTASMHSHVNHFPLPHLSPFPQSQFPSIALSPSLSPALFPTPAPLIGHPLAHPLHLVSTTAIHPTHLTLQALPHTTLIPTHFTQQPNTGIHPTIQLHPLIHPLFQGQDFHHLSGPSH